MVTNIYSYQQTEQVQSGQGKRPYLWLGALLAGLLLAAGFSTLIASWLVSAGLGTAVGLIATALIAKQLTGQSQWGMVMAGQVVGMLTILVLLLG
jgi:hypothetical protein